MSQQKLTEESDGKYVNGADKTKPLRKGKTLKSLPKRKTWQSRQKLTRETADKTNEKTEEDKQNNEIVVEIEPIPSSLADVVIPVGERVLNMKLITNTDIQKMREVKEAAEARDEGVSKTGIFKEEKVPATEYELENRKTVKKVQPQSMWQKMVRRRTAVSFLTKSGRTQPHKNIQNGEKEDNNTSSVASKINTSQPSQSNTIVSQSDTQSATSQSHIDSLSRESTSLTIKEEQDGKRSTEIRGMFKLGAGIVAGQGQSQYGVDMRTAADKAERIYRGESDGDLGGKKPRWARAMEAAMEKLDGSMNGVWTRHRTNSLTEDDREIMDVLANITDDMDGEG